MDLRDNLLIAFLLPVLFITRISSLPEEVPIGGLFLSSEENDTQLAFQYAVDVMNEEKAFSSWKLKAEPAVVPQFERFFSQMGACRLMESGIVAMIGPNSPATAEHIQSVCDAMEMPHIETRWDGRRRRKECSVNLYPAADALSQAIYDIVKIYKWTKFTIIYQDIDSLQRLNLLLKMYDPKGFPVTLHQLSDDGNYRPGFKMIKKSGANYFIVDCSIDILEEVLTQAQQVGLMVAGYNYLITNFDFHTLNLGPFQYAGTNITGIRIVLPDDNFVSNFTTNFAGYAGAKDIITAETLRVETALMYDSVQLLTRALERLDDTQEVNIRPLDCNSDISWEHGCSLANFMKTSEITGLSGAIRFDTEGLRSDFALDIVELLETGLYSVGNWNISEGIKMHREELEYVFEYPKSNSSLHNMSFTVLISMTDPYGMLKDSSIKLYGNDRYEGYCVDLIKELAILTGFNYTFEVQEDNDYGSLDKETKQWTGMMKEIIEGRADLAITDLTITHDREAYVDFTMPFMNLGIALLYLKPTPIAPSLFSFLSPFSFEVWGYLFMAYCIVSLQLFVQARMAPAEWNNPYPCIEEPEELENQFSLNNSFWFSIGAFLQQGTEIAPIAVSTRMTAGMWWFFTMIMVSSYTANLAAFLTVVQYSSPINSVEDLAAQTEIKYGSKKGGSTYNFFKESEDELYKHMWATMSRDPSVFTKDNTDGWKRVKSGGYAFFMESTSIEYLTERHCELKQIGGLLDAKNYGIAMRKHAPYRNILSTGVLKLQENGRLQEIKRRWWKQRKGGGACVDAGQGGAEKLDLSNLGGVFLVLGIGLAGAAVVAALELTCHNYYKSKEEKISFKEEMIEDLKFIARCHGSSKEVRKPKSSKEMLREVLEDFQPVSSYATTTPFQKDQANSPSQTNFISRRNRRNKTGSPTGSGTSTSSDNRAA